MEIRRQSLIKKILLVLLLGMLAFVLLNFGFFSQNIRFYLGQVGEKNDMSSVVDSTGQMNPDTLVISNLGVTAPIVFPISNTEGAYQIALRDGVAHYPGTAHAGEVGNMYIFGHSSDFVFSAGDYKTIFSLLPKIEEGTEIEISDSLGRRFVYKVSRSYATDKNDLTVLSQDTGSKKILTLQTSYPIGTALRRWIVIAEIIE